MISFKPVVYRHQRRRDGTWNVKIRVTFKGVSRHLPTTIFLYQSDVSTKMKIKSQNVLMKCEPLLRQMRESVGKLSPFALDVMTVDDVVAWMRKDLTPQVFHMGLKEYFTNEFSIGRKESSASVYEISIRSFLGWLGKPDVEMNEVTVAMVKEFLDAKEKSGIITAPNYVRYIAYIYRTAMDRYNDEDTGRIRIRTNPFAGANPKRVVNKGQQPASPELIQMLINAKAQSRQERFAIDAFLISFALMGANVVDLFNAKKPKNGVWTYNRQKTRDRKQDSALMKVKVPQQILPILSRHTAPASDPHWLKWHLMHESTTVVTHFVNRYLKRWSDENGQEAFTMYAARKGFATIARSSKVGAEKATVDEALSHAGDMPVGDIYIAKDWDVINAVNEKVLALFDWSGLE